MAEGGDGGTLTACLDQISSPPVSLLVPQPLFPSQVMCPLSFYQYPLSPFSAACVCVCVNVGPSTEYGMVTSQDLHLHPQRKLTLPCPAANQLSIILQTGMGFHEPLTPYMLRFGWLDLTQMLHMQSQSL